MPLIPNRAITGSYYNKADAVVIVYDLAQKVTWKNVQKWVSDSARDSPSSVKFILGNKSDLGIYPIFLLSFLLVFLFFLLKIQRFLFIYFLGKFAVEDYEVTEFCEEYDLRGTKLWHKEAQIESYKVSALNDVGIEEAFERLANLILENLEVY